MARTKPSERSPPSVATRGRSLPPPIAGGRAADAGKTTYDVSDARASSANSTADRAIDILLLFSLETPVWTTAQIAEYFAMPRSTTHRYISSLRACALLVESANGGWKLGPRIFPLARAAAAGNSVIGIAAPFLRELNEAFGEAVFLYERIGLDTVALERLETTHRVKLIYSRGQILPWPGAASAKVLLAFAPPSVQRAALQYATPVQYTPRTIRSVRELRGVLKMIARDGFAYSDQERDEGIRAIAAPVFARGDGRLCITMSGPVFRMTDDKLSIMIARVRKIADAISAALQSAEI